MADETPEKFDPFDDEFLYQELRKLAAKRLAKESPGQTLDATALVHEAYLRLFPSGRPRSFVNEAHFFASAAEAMRRILVDNARRKLAIKRGGDQVKVELVDHFATSDPETELIDLDEAVRYLQEHDKRKADVVKLRYFAGLTTSQIATTLQISVSTVEADWVYAKAWLKVWLNKG